MKRRWMAYMVLAMACSVRPALAAESAANDVWVLKFADDFERADLGADWLSNDAVIRDGRMLLGLNGSACAKVARSFPGDVRIECTVLAYEKRPPCDLSMTLAAETFPPMSWTYLLAFGGTNNTENRIGGGRRLRDVRVSKPKMMIEPGRTYALTAVKEGKRIAMYVDGELLMEGTDEQVMGGPGFESVGLVTWNGMYVDDLRVYERKMPHPDTPRYVSELVGLVLSINEAGQMVASRDADHALARPEVKAAIDAYNRGHLAAAEQAFQPLGGELRASGLAYVYGHLNYDEKPESFPLVAQLFAEVAKANPGDQRLKDYAWAASLFGRVRIFPRAAQECSLLVYLGPKNNPFYDKAKLYRARFLRANAQEGANAPLLAAANAMLKELHAKAPDNPLLRQLAGQDVPWGNELMIGNPGAPRWAALLQEIYNRQLAVMHWWFTKRQMPDGQLGGGWGDDVELLRSWGPFAMISNADPVVRDGIERLCQGVWDRVLKDGFEPELGDVEHSSEPSADTLPTMLAIRYGDPIWFERNLASCRRIREYYTGIDKNGFVRFKSGYFGGDKASTHLQDGGDTFYSCRPMKHFFWPAWYGHEEARQFYLSWARGWVAATMTAKYSKPAGVPPGTIWYPSGDIAPPNGASWDDPTYNIYGCCSIGNFWIQDVFLAGYYLSRDPYFLQPLHAWMGWYQSEPPANAATQPDLNTDPLAWAIVNSRRGWNIEPWRRGGLVSTLSEYRWMTGDPTYDEVFGIPIREQERLHFRGDFNVFLDRLEEMLKQLRVNFDLYTHEVLQTDRAPLPGSDLSFSAFTGAVRLWVDAGVPTLAVTWEAPHPRFAALVVNSSADHLRVWIYNGDGQPMRLGARLWQLQPGQYAVRSGPVGGGEGLARRYHWREPTAFAVRHRADVCWLDVPARQEFCADFRLIRAMERPAVLADPAICDRDVTVENAADGTRKVSVQVHNLGSVPVADLQVTLVAETNGVRETVKQAVVEQLPAVQEFKPAAVTVTFAGVPSKPNLLLVLDPQGRVPEIYALNNTANVR